jgi:hypothetical protein
LEGAMKPLNGESFLSYLRGGNEGVLNKWHVNKELRGPHFPLLRKMLENPLEELISITNDEGSFQEAVDSEGGAMFL